MSSFSDNYKAAGRAALGGKSLEDFNDYNTSIRLYADQNGKKYLIRLGNDAKHSELEKQGLTIRPVMRVVEDGKLRDYVADSEEDLEAIQHKGVETRPFVGLDNTLKWSHVDKDEFDKVREKDLELFYKRNEIFNNAGKEATETPGILKQLGMELARVGNETIAKPLVGLSTMINAGLHYATGGNSNTVGRWFGENADYTADVYQKLNEFSANMDIRQYVDEDSWQYNTASVFQGITDLATQLLIAQGVSAATSLLTSTSVKTAAGVVNYGAAPAVQLAAPTFKQMAVQGAKEFVTGPGASYAVMQAGGSAGETFSEARANNLSMGEATWLATVDGMTSMALARVEKALGATFGGGSALQQGYIRIFNSPAKWQIAKDIAKGVGIEMASEAADTYSHMSFLQAAGAEIYEEDKWMAMGTAILYAGFASGIAEGAGYMQQRGDIQRMRKDYAAARTFQSDLARQNPTVVKNIENGQPTLIEGSIPGGVKMVEANGDVRFGDGTVSHIDGSMTTVTGVVVDNNGSIVTAGPAKSEGVELDLFKLIRGGDMTVYNIPLNEISVNERITQFKNDANPDTGEVIPLEGQFQPIPTKPILVMEFNDGRKEVVTGRHRLGLARRNGLETIPCNIIREKDGWTIEMAKTMDAYDNILDNQGSDKDFVDFFRHSRVTDEEIRHHKELISRPRQRMAYDVARGASEDLYSYVSAENKYVTLDVAAAISQNAPMGKSPMAESIQRAALRAALDGMRATEVAIYTRSLAQAYADKVATAGIQQLDLFGGDDTFELAMQVQARYASRKVAEIDLDLQSFRQILGKKSSTLTARQSLLDKYSIANVEDVQAIRSVMETLEQKKLEWKNYHLNPELSKEARDFAHKQLHIEPMIVETPSGEMMTVSQLESELSLDDESRRRIEAENAIDAGLSDNDTMDLFGEQNASYKTSLWEAFEEPYWTQWRDSAPSPEMFRVRSYLVSRMLDRAKKTVDPATSLPFYSEIDRLSAMMKNIPRIEQNVIPLDHGDVSIDDVEKMFYSYMGEKPKTKRGVQSEPNADKDVLALAQRLFALARKYDIRFKFDSINDIFVFGKSRAGDIVLSYEAFGSSYLSDMTKGSVILHEIIHSLTSWGLDAKGNVDPRAPEAWKNAWKDFEQTYDAMKKELRTLHYPATRNASEFVANLGMPAFRAELRQMNLWERTWDAIKRFVTRLTKTEEKDPRVREVDLLNESLNRLDVLLSNIDEQMFIAKRDAFRLEANKKRLKYFSGRGGDGSVMFVNEPVVPRRMDVTVDDETKTTKSDSSRLETFDGFEQPELFVAGNTNPNYIQDTLFDKPNNVFASKYKAGWYRIMSNDAYETRIQEMTTEQLGWEIYQNELIVEAMEEYRSKFNGSDERKAKLDADIQRAKEQVTRAEEVIRLRKDFQASTGVTYKAGHISIDDVERMYHHYAKGDKALAALAQRLFKFARQYNLTFNMANIRSSDKLGEALRGDIAFSLDVFNHKLISNEDKASTILHEIIHGLTTWGRSYTTRKAKIDAPEAWKKAWSELDNMYQELKPQLQRMKLYGATNVDEFVAELSNPTFRAELKRRNLWERAWGAVKRFVRYLIGDENGRAKEVNALDAALERLDTLLDNIDSDLIAEEINIGKTRRRSPFHHMKKEGEVRFDSDYDKAIRLGDFTDNPITSSDVVPPEPTMQMELNLDGIQSDNWYQTTLFRNVNYGEFPDTLEEVVAPTTVATLTMGGHRDRGHAEANARSEEEGLAYAQRLANTDGTRTRGDYLLAKYHGDVTAAEHTIERVFQINNGRMAPSKVKAIAALKAKLDPEKSVVYIPIMNREGHKNNVLPQQYATFLASLIGGTVDTNIMKVSEDSNTNASTVDRAQRSFTFEGDIQVGENTQIVLVDDVYTTGSTITALMNYLKDRHPNIDVVAISTLGAGMSGRGFKPSKNILQKVSQKSTISSEILKEAIGYGYENFTGAQLHGYLFRNTVKPGRENAIAYFSRLVPEVEREVLRNAARGSSSTESDEALGRQNTSNGRDNQDLNYARSSFGVATNNENVEMLPEATVPFGYVAPELDPMNEAGEAAQAYYPRSILEVSIYPNGGRVPVMGSPADKASRLPLSLPQVVAMYRQLSRGKTPIVVSNKAHGPRQALGWYRPDAQTISVRSQLFGLTDQSDVIFLHDKLKERGFFKHEDPEWCSTVTRAEQEHERNASTQNLEKALARMIDNRVKAGYHQGAGVKVLAHELWHMIDDTDGGQTIKEKKTFLDHLRNVKREFSDIAGEQLFNKVSKNEVISFLEWWQGAPLGKYGSKPRELYAEIGCAFCLDPGSMREKAPNLYEAMVENLQRHPQALNAWKALDDEILKGTDLDQTFQRLNATWEKNAEIERRKARDEINRDKNNAKMKMAHIFLDRYQPIIMVVEESQRDIREKLKKDFNDGHISQHAYNRGIEMLDKELLDIKYQRNLYTHQYGRSKIFLADLNEQVLKVAKERNVTMRDLNTYLHLKRVIEIQNRATAHGIDAPTAHRMLKRMEARLGAIQMNNIVTVAKTFRAIYERSVIDNPDVQEMLGSQSIEMMRKNQHYVTMRHTVDPEKIEEVNQAKTGDALLDAALNDLRGLAGERTGGIGYTLHKLEGSFRATISPILATAQTAITILETAQRNHALIQLSQTLQNHRQRDFRVLNPGEKPFNTKRYGVLSYMKDGKIEHIMVPRPVADAINAESYTVNTLTLANRIMNAGFTTNSLAFIPSAYMRDLASLSQNNPGLRRSFLHYATVMNLGTLLSPLAAIPGVRRVSTPVATLLNVGSWASFAAQFIPPHVMKRISQNPIGRLLLNNKTVEYWSSYGHTCAKIIQTMNFEGTLKAAADARAKGQHAKARELEYCAIMARHALEDGVLLTMNQLRRDDYSKADIARVFEKYNLKYELDEDITPLSSKIRKYLKDLKKRPVKTLTAGVIEGAKKAVSAYWESSGYLSELEAMTVKLSGYCAFHAQRAGEYGYATGDTRTNVALQTVEMAGDPDFTKKGMLANQIEMFFSPFWNARKEGTRRTVRALKNNPRDWTSKMLLDGVLPRVASLLLSSGVAAGLLLKAFSKNEDPRELEGTLAGDVYDYLVWQQKALKNETIYTKTNYRCLPVWMSQDGHTSFCLRTPIPDEIKAAEMAVIAAWNAAGLDSDMPNTNAGDAVATFMRQFFPDLEGRGSVVSHFRNIVYPWLLDTNPYERHLNRNLYTDEEFAARWTRPYAIETTLKNAWNNTPLVNMKRFQLRSHVGNVSEDAVSFKELLETPIIGPVLARFGSLSSAGIEQTASQFVEINKVEQAARSLDVKRAAKDFYLEGKPLPEDISGDWEALDQFLKEVKKIDNRESLSPRERAIKKIDSIREDNPELWERAFKNLHNTPRYTDGRRI